MHDRRLLDVVEYGVASTKTNLAAEGKNANGNSISQQSEIIANGERPYDDNLSMTGNASIRNQSQTITASDSMRAKRDDANFNTDGERVLSRKRRYLIFPPGSSIQIGNGKNEKKKRILVPPHFAVDIISHQGS